MSGSVIYLRNKRIPRAEKVKYTLLFRYTEKKYITIYVEVYINENRGELVLNDFFAHLRIFFTNLRTHGWIIIKFLGMEEFNEFINSICSVEGDKDKFLKIVELCSKAEEVPNRIKIIPLEEDYEIIHE